jgi:ABC-type transport system involved in multi-copper enzyme maturation permease subunit
MSRTKSIEVERSTGAKRGLIQIQKTMNFEFKRGWVKLLSMIGTSFLIFILGIVTEVIRFNRDGYIADNSSDYFVSYLGFISLLINIIAVTFAGSIITEDFEKSTGNLLFPKIPKHRLLIGRYLARYLYGVTAVLSYYIFVGVTTLIRFGEFPIEVLYSFGWAAFYLFAVFAFVTLFSSFFKRSTGAIIVSLISLLMVFAMIEVIMTITGVEIELPHFFVLSYYSNIISLTFNMPEVRGQEFPLLNREGIPTGATIFQWSTPSELGAILGLIIYSVVLLAAAYLIYRSRQNKANM